jgi:hypothetical protein
VGKEYSILILIYLPGACLNYFELSYNYVTQSCLANCHFIHLGLLSATLQLQLMLLPGAAASLAALEAKGRPSVWVPSWRPFEDFQRQSINRGPLTIYVTMSHSWGGSQQFPDLGCF